MEREQLHDEIERAISGKSLRLPTLPEIALQAKTLADDPDSSAKDLADLIVTDAALSARLLSVSNSALYRPINKITTIQMAVSRLGTSKIKSLIMALLVKEIYQDGDPAVADILRSVWEETLEVSALSHLIASKINYQSPDEAMIAGLISNIGALPVIDRAKGYPALMRNQEALSNVINALSPEVGSLILNEWGFPDDMKAVALIGRDLSQSQGGDSPSLVDIVQVAFGQMWCAKDPSINLNIEAISAYQRIDFVPSVTVIAPPEPEAADPDLESIKALFAA